MNKFISQKYITFLLIILFLVIFINQIILININRNLPGKQGQNSKSNSSLSFDSSGDIVRDSVSVAIAKGTPDLYGEELGVSFDSVEYSINILRQFDPTYGNKRIELSGDDFKRYIDIGLKIACEYCCGAKSLVFSDGSAACGCAHSQAMRGLAAYLIKNHGSEYSDDKILRELARWKGRFFPKQMIKKVAYALSSGNYTPDTAALLIGVDVSKKYNNNNEDIPLPSEINNLPSMVGGC